MFAIVIFVGAEDEKLRAGSAREQRRLRATLAEEPSSSYAYHDEARVEQVRTPSGAKPANDTQPPAKPRSHKATMIGHQAPIAVSPDKMAPMLSPSIRTVTTGSGTKARPALSEPPDIGSWPPLPNVPPELEGAADEPVRARYDSDSAPTDPPRRSEPARRPPSGAIWGAVPPVVSQAPEDDIASVLSDEPPAEHGAVAARAEPLPMQDARLSPDVAEPSYRDPELKRLEPLVERGAWENLAKELSTDPSHSAEYRLLRILAQRETLPTDDKAAGRLTQDAIVALAELLGVPATSPTALMLAKRLLRRNPVWTQNQPSSGLSFSIVIIGLLVGTGLGWLLTRFVL